MASGGRIPDDSFTASSIFAPRYAAKYGRLNGRKVWEPKTNTDPDDYLQIDLLYEYVICAVATQGSPPTQSSAQEWTTEYKLRFSLNGTTFSPYKENKIDKVGMSCSHIQVFIAVLYFQELIVIYSNPLHVHVRINTVYTHPKACSLLVKCMFP